MNSSSGSFKIELDFQNPTYMVFSSKAQSISRLFTMSSLPTSPIVKERRVSSDEYQRFTVSFQKASILTILTNNSSIVDKWILEVYHAHQHRIDSLVVGLDVEWRPSYVSKVTYPVAILQLCVGRRCLIFQFLYADNIPESLYEFLAKPNFSFVGVGVKEDARKLDRDYGLVVNKPVELPALAADIYEMKELRRAGLKKLTNFVLGYDVDKSKEITMSRWDYWSLSHEQVGYACIDAYISFQIGKTLIEDLLEDDFP